MFKPERTDRTSRFPVVAFGIGWGSWTSRYARTLTHLASHGFIVVAPSVADRVARPASFSALAGNLRACLEWAAAEGRRDRSPLYRLVDRTRLGLFGHSSGGGAAARAALDVKRTSAGVHLKALAGLGVFVPASRLELAELAGLRDIAVLQMAGQRDLHTTPRSVAAAVDAMRQAVPRATAVIRRGTHCWLDEAEAYVYPPSQCDAARDGAVVFGQEVLSPEAQNAVTREYLASFFIAQLGDGTMGLDATVVREARRRMWGREGNAAGARLREDVRLVAEPEAVEGVFLPSDLTLSKDPRMSRVEVTQ